jgi:hypothetical protein
MMTDEFISGCVAAAAAFAPPADDGRIAGGVSAPRATRPVLADVTGPSRWLLNLGQALLQAVKLQTNLRLHGGL